MVHVHFFHEFLLQMLIYKIDINKKTYLGHMT